jgi:hypothetical protein
VIIIPASVEAICKACFANCGSLTSVTFESSSKLQRIEESVFQWSGLTAIIIPASVEVLCKECFSYCRSLASIEFELGSTLCEVAVDSFAQSLRLHRIEFPRSLHKGSRPAVWGACEVC